VVPFFCVFSIFFIFAFQLSHFVTDSSTMNDVSFWMVLLGTRCGASVVSTIGMRVIDVIHLFPFISGRASSSIVCSRVVQNPLILLVTLNYLKEYSTLEQLESRWGLSHTTCFAYFLTGLEALFLSLPPLSLTDRFNQEACFGYENMFRNVLLAADGTCCRVERPSENNLQHLYYSGHRREHCVVYEAAARLRDGYFCWVAGPAPGSLVDITLLRLFGLLDQLLPNERAVFDKGYVGLSPERALTPFRATSSHPLTIAQIVFNMLLEQGRVIVEDSFSRVKEWQILEKPFRGDLSRHCLIFFVCVMISNFLMQSRPLRADPHANYFLN